MTIDSCTPTMPGRRGAGILVDPATTMPDNIMLGQIAPAFHRGNSIGMGEGTPIQVDVKPTFGEP